MSSTASAVSPRNETSLTRSHLKAILAHFSTLIPNEFGTTPVRLVVHGGAAMLLHPHLHALAKKRPYDALPRRKTTRDVDIIKRGFVTEYTALGFPDAAQRLDRCIASTAEHFQLGLDWMNADADIALPMARDGTTHEVYDPIYTSAITSNNVEMHTIYQSENGMLTLISVAPFWAVALKLARFQDMDKGDVCLILRNGSNVHWTTKTLEDWIFSMCWPMGYHTYSAEKMAELKRRIVESIELVEQYKSMQGFIPPGVPMPAGPPFVAVPEEYSDRFGHVDAFDKSIKNFLGTSSVAYPSAHPFVKQKHKKEKKESTKDKTKTKKRRDKARDQERREKRGILNWRDPDDSDDDSEGTESWEHVSSRVNHFAPNGWAPAGPPPPPPYDPASATLVHQFAQMRSPSGWGPHMSPAHGRSPAPPQSHPPTSPTGQAWGPPPRPLMYSSPPPGPPAINVQPASSPAPSSRPNSYPPSRISPPVTSSSLRAQSSSASTPVPHTNYLSPRPEAYHRTSSRSWGPGPSHTPPTWAMSPARLPESNGHGSALPPQPAQARYEDDDGWPRPPSHRPPTPSTPSDWTYGKKKQWWETWAGAYYLPPERASASLASRQGGPQREPTTPPFIPPPPSRSPSPMARAGAPARSPRASGTPPEDIFVPPEEPSPPAHQGWDLSRSQAGIPPPPVISHSSWHPAPQWGPNPNLSSWQRHSPYQGPSGHGLSTPWDVKERKLANSLDVFV